MPHKACLFIIWDNQIKRQTTLNVGPGCLIDKLNLLATIMIITGQIWLKVMMNLLRGIWMWSCRDLKWTAWLRKRCFWFKSNHFHCVLSSVTLLIYHRDFPTMHGCHRISCHMLGGQNLARSCILIKSKCQQF